MAAISSADADPPSQHFSHAHHHHSPSPLSDSGEPQHVLILYASETGDAQDVAERVARAFRCHHRRAITMSMDAYDIADLPHEPLLILVTSTHGRGEPPPAMRGLWSKLIRAGLPNHILEGKFEGGLG
jgi:sulfite reductase alpha subunit-like flavoprotein